MPQKDYILRMIEQMALVVAEIRRRILGGESVEMEGELRTMATHAGLDLYLARTLDAESILSLLAPTGDVDPTRLWLVAELLYLEGLAQRYRADPTARQTLAKARQLYGALDYGVVASVIPDATDRIEELNGLLNGSDV